MYIYTCIQTKTYNIHVYIMPIYMYPYIYLNKHMHTLIYVPIYT